jgi:SAM-dependent methyltransferase
VDIRKRRSVIMETPLQESRRPPRNVQYRKGFFALVRRKLVRFADLQVASVEKGLGAWLAAQHGRLLEVGCGDQPYRRLVPSACIYRGLDIVDAKEGFDANTTPDVTTYAGGQFPFSDGSFDCLFHTDVIEHVYDFQLFLTECHRVLRKDGSIYFAVPFQARYHYIPFDYWRFTPASLQKLLEQAGFTNVVVKARGTDITVAMYKMVAVPFRWAYGNFFGKLGFILSAPFVIPMLAIAHLSSLWEWGSADDCLGFEVTGEA